ncbi:hypothetical protein Tsubulata_036212 [Turnera subulata]|uniref:CHY-type domain-containing protein n=1 Tax=Turnera subulata TaxID=218843 RepID=A0A9Q0FRL5_9ROSI|nr:hypothetical protein Tsubulata_036212 [Turnera subulata]
MGGDSPACPPDEDDEQPPPPVDAEDSFSNVPLSDAPVLLLFCFHKAMRGEIAELKRLVVTASEECGPRGELVAELRRRFDFLRLAYKYHTAAEDEVIFFALDVRVKNVAGAYSLEHDSIDDLFDSVFQWLNEFKEGKNDAEPLEELLFCISILQSSICEHMLKEEKQIFPLLMQKFSAREQASLVWQFICSVPVILLEDLFPWMFSFLSQEKQVDVTYCIKEIVPKEDSLQEVDPELKSQLDIPFKFLILVTLLLKVVILWLQRNSKTSSWAFTENREESSDGPEKMDSVALLQCFGKPFQEKRQWMKTHSVETDVGNNNLSDGLHLWHAAIKKDLREMFEGLCKIRSSSNSPDISSITVRLRFLADVVIFYSNALKKFFYPMLNDFGDHQFSPSGGLTAIESCVESLHCLLHCNYGNDVPSCKVVDQLCQELESFNVDISKQFHFQETEVFPIISKYCSHEAQQHLLYASLHVMPLGLLKCVITWFASHLSKNASNCILQILMQGEFSENRSFTSLLLDWFSIGYLGKTSVDSFGDDLEKMFKNRFSFQPLQIEEAVRCPSLRLKMQHSQEFIPFKMEADNANKGKKILNSFSPSGSRIAKSYEVPYSSDISMHVLFHKSVRELHPFHKLSGEDSSAASVLNEPIPVDLIFFFHKALKKDLEYLVLASTQLAENVGLVMKFCQHFHLLQFRYQLHSAAEDEIAFPALEAKNKVQNISQSYTIDHKHEVKHFLEISLILDEISKLHNSVSIDSTMQDQFMVKHKQLCRKLHLMCISMHKLLSDHVHREEVELWPLFRKCFSNEEQEKIVGRILGRIKAETLQDIIPWLISSLTPEEQQAMMSLWREVTRHTMFDEWLREWWEGFGISQVEVEANTSNIMDPLEIIDKYLSKEALDEESHSLCNKVIELSRDACSNGSLEMFHENNWNDMEKVCNEDQTSNEIPKCSKLSKGENKNHNEGTGAKGKIGKPGQGFRSDVKSAKQEHVLRISQDDLEAAIRRVSRDSSLDPQKKSYIIQNLLMSGWIVRQQISQEETTIAGNAEEVPGQHPSYRDPQQLTFGCKHYKRNCKLLAACCNQLYTCIRCHDEDADHSTERRAIKKMMCMKCLVIQPIGQKCSTLSCNNLSMARYYCRICRLFDDEREIYHCPYCNLCRVGKGLGIDYFHCMNCNACMARSLSVHVCREKCLEENCPICHEFIFTSSIPVKALPCGHLMHSTCFQDYTCTHYTCPICSKSLGDMQVYFNMLDALLAEEKIPDEFSGRTQAILCNDCEKKGVASFHWLYHKCPYCGSYNTRLL